MLLSSFNRLISGRLTQRYSAGQSAAVMLFSYYFQSGLNFLRTKRKSLPGCLFYQTFLLQQLQSAFGLFEKQQLTKVFASAGLTNVSISSCTLFSISTVLTLRY